MKLTDCTATELLELLKSSAVTPKEIAQSCIERIREVDPAVNAWEYFDEAAIEAQLAKIKTYNPDDYPLYGIPVGVKDIYNTFDMPDRKSVV